MRNSKNCHQLHKDTAEITITEHFRNRLNKYLPGNPFIFGTWGSKLLLKVPFSCTEKKVLLILHLHKQTMWFIISRDFIHTFLVLSDAGHWPSSYISMPHTPYNNLKLIMSVVPIQLFTYMWDLKYKFNTVDHRENREKIFLKSEGRKHDLFHFYLATRLQQADDTGKAVCLCSTKKKSQN